MKMTHPTWGKRPCGAWFFLTDFEKLRTMKVVRSVSNEHQIEQLKASKNADVLVSTRQEYKLVLMVAQSDHPI